MKAIYSEPKTKAMTLNVSAAICSEPIVSSDPITGTPTGDEAVKAPMF